MHTLDHKNTEAVLCNLGGWALASRDAFLPYLSKPFPLYRLYRRLPRQPIIACAAQELLNGPAITLGEAVARAHGRDI